MGHKLAIGKLGNTEGSTVGNSKIAGRVFHIMLSSSVYIHKHTYVFVQLPSAPTEFLCTHSSQGYKLLGFFSSCWMGLLLSKESFVVYIVCIYNSFILPIYASICENENCSFSLE